MQLLYVPYLLVRIDKMAMCDVEDYGVVGVHHVGILCQNLERSLHFYQNILGNVGFPYTMIIH